MLNNHTDTYFPLWVWFDSPFEGWGAILGVRVVIDRTGKKVADGNASKFPPVPHSRVELT